MKKINLVGFLMAAMILMCIIGIAIADAVGDRASIALNGNGIGTWTNKVPYAAIKITKIWVEQNGLTPNTCAVKRVTLASNAAGDAYAHTQTCASVTITAANDNGQATISAPALVPLDKLTFACTGTNAQGGVAVIEYEVQRP